MARTIRDARLEKWEQRKNLKVQWRYFRDIGDGIALCYRRGAAGGTWSVRIRDTKGRYALRGLGIADDFLPADGDRVLTYRQATAKAIDEAERGPAPSYAVRDACDDYLEWFRDNRKSIDATQAAIDAHIRPAFADRTVASLTAEDIKAWRDKLARGHARKRTRKGKAQAHKEQCDELTDEQREETKRARRATANRILAVLKAILNKAFEDGKARDDTEWRRVKPFPNVDVPRVRFLIEDEAVRLVNGCSAEFRPLLRAALLTGARYGELVRLTAANFNPITSQLFIAPSKSGKSRYIPLNSSGVALFKSLTIGRAADAPMFVRADGERWGKNHQQRPLSEACKRAKITPPLRFHEARHSYASALAQAGADLLTISKLLGHADTRITSRHYAHLCDKTLANAVNNLLPDFGAVEESNVAAIR
jgi:integrase